MAAMGVPLAYFPRLLNAMPTQREHYEISGGGSGLHWDEINEDISVESFLVDLDAFDNVTHLSDAACP